MLEKTFFFRLRKRKEKKKKFRDRRKKRNNCSEIENLRKKFAGREGKAANRVCIKFELNNVVISEKILAGFYTIVVPKFMSFYTIGY